LEKVVFFLVLAAEMAAVAVLEEMAAVEMEHLEPDLDKLEQ
jgi:hypothetical protein